MADISANQLLRKKTAQRVWYPINERGLVVKLVISLCFGVILLVAPIGYAASLDDAKAGLDALNSGDNATAIRLFTRALRGGGLSPADRELAYVKRAQAYIAENRNDLAQADVRQALKLNPNDEEAANLQQQVLTGPRGETTSASCTVTNAGTDFTDGAATIGGLRFRSLAGNHFSGNTNSIEVDIKSPDGSIVAMNEHFESVVDPSAVCRVVTRTTKNYRVCKRDIQVTFLGCMPVEGHPDLNRPGYFIVKDVTF